MSTTQTSAQHASPFPNRRLQWRRHEDLKLLQRERELEAARRICQALFQHINVDELVERALQTALDVVGAEAGSVLLAELETKHLVFRYIAGVGAELLHGTRMPWDKGIAGAVFHSGEPAIIGDVASDDRHFSAIDAHTGYTTRDMIVLPLRRWGANPSACWRSSTSAKASGTGLGTKIVKDVVDAHGGQISVDSEEGMGTTFHILLPFHPPGCYVH